MWLLSEIVALRPFRLRLQTLVLDLDETLVHSSFKPVASADFVIPVRGKCCGWMGVVT